MTGGPLTIKFTGSAVSAVCFLICCTFSGCTGENDDIYFFCGSAVKVPMDDVIRNYEEDTGIKVSVVYGGSGSLLSQMELARKGDLYLSGSPDYISVGEEKGILVKDTARIVVYLVPSIIVPEGNAGEIQTLEDLTEEGMRVGTGNPESVCLGLYSVELLEENNLMESILPNVVVLAKSCEDAAMQAVLGKVDAVLGWDVFETWNPQRVDRISISPERIPRLSYAAVATPVFCADKLGGKALADYILSPGSRAVFENWGYITDREIAVTQAENPIIGGKYSLPESYYEIISGEK